MIVVAYQLNGAVTVSELLGSTLLFRACTRVLARARGVDIEAAEDPDAENLAFLAARTTSLGR